MKNQKQVISENDLIVLLNNQTKYQFTNVKMRTIPKMNKTGNPYFEKIEKETEGNFNVGVDYERRVKNNEDKEGLPTTFESEKPKGKHHISKCVLRSDKDENVHYVMLERFTNLKPKVEFYFEGQTIEKHLFESFIPPISESKKQVQQKKVEVMTPKISNIMEITLNGTRYEIQH